MQTVATLISGIALVLATLQAWVSYQARDDHIEAIMAGQRMQACAAVGRDAAAMIAAARPMLPPARLGAEDVQRLQRLAPTVRQSAYAAGYVLPTEAQEILETLPEDADAVTQGVFSGDDSAAAALDRFEARSRDLQVICRQRIAG